jgi:hypothetical protein
MIRVNLIPWRQLTRNGVPEMVVARRPMSLHGSIYQPGHPVSPQDFVNRVRMRQLYEQRLLEPLHAPRGSVQEARDRMQVKRQQRQPVQAPAVAVQSPMDPLLDLVVSTPVPQATAAKGYQPGRVLRQAKTRSR